MSRHPESAAHCLTPILYVRDFEEAMDYYTGKRLFERGKDRKAAGRASARVGRTQAHGAGEILEETFLHTFEKMPGGGVASPHTERTLSYIEGLKKKHGIDYDTHASYRFVEKADHA